MEKQNEPKKRLSVLEIYHARGWLNNAYSKWSAEDRLTVGLRLAADFYRAGYVPVVAIDYGKERVDNSVKEEPEWVLDARQRYNDAIRSVPNDYWPVVREVCCLNKYIKVVGKNKVAQGNDRYRKLFDLCRGLDCLVWHYLRGKE